MAKHTTYLGKNKIEYEVDTSQKLFPEKSKIKSNIKPDTNYLDTDLCNIPDPPQTTVKIPNIPFTDIPTPMPPIEIPKTVLAALLPCAKKGLFPCPDLRITETFEMSDEELDECNSKNALRIPITLALDYRKTNPDYEFTDDPAVEDIMGYVYIRPFFVSKCCCDAENDEDVIEIRVGWRYKFRRPRFRLPRIKFPCPDIRFKTKVKSGNTSDDIGKIKLNVTSDVDTYDCRKMRINVDMRFSIPNMIRSIRWVDVSQNGCLVAKKLVIDRANVIIAGDHLQFGPVTETEDLFFAPIQELNCDQEQPPITQEISVIGSINYYQSQDETTINWQELKLKFCCGRLVGVTIGNSDSVTIDSCGDDEPSSGGSSEEIPSSNEEIGHCWETTIVD